jgi:ABC-type branched-subunit amino acid transport system ATPase component
MISITNLSFHFGARAMYDEANLHIKPGDKIGLIGSDFNLPYWVCKSTIFIRMDEVAILELTEGYSKFCLLVIKFCQALFCL